MRLLKGIAYDVHQPQHLEQLFYADSNTDQGVKSLGVLVRYGFGQIPTPAFFIETLNGFKNSDQTETDFEDLTRKLIASDRIGFSKDYRSQAMMFEMNYSEAGVATFQKPEIVLAETLAQYTQKSCEDKTRLKIFKTAADIIVAPYEHLAVATTFKRATEYFQKQIYDNAQSQHKPLLAIGGQGHVFVVDGAHQPEQKGLCPFSSPLRRPAAGFNLLLLDMWQQFDGLDKAGITPELMQPVAGFLNAHPELKKMQL